MSRQKTRSQLDMVNQINMTPMVDLVLLLLIIFMITAPLIEYAIDVSPPKFTQDQKKRPDNEKMVTVSLNSKGEFIYKYRALSEAQLFQELNTLYKTEPKTPVMIRADAKQPYERVIDLLKVVSRSGFENASLVTQAEDVK
ncbi:MAG: hypothetical protein A2X49_05945 [Lentisphaerae bacterium GWF2_52_8]|nr:MAG: hypothetical protein A2X49_05945 [Lentisphaerae bacterium GWF2_52_8]